MARTNRTHSNAQYVHFKALKGYITCNQCVKQLLCTTASTEPLGLITIDIIMQVKENEPCDNRMHLCLYLQAFSVRMFTVFTEGYTGDNMEPC